MTLTYVQADDDINAMVTAAITAGAPAIVGYVLDIRYAGVVNNVVPDATKHWARVNIHTVLSKQTAFVGDTPSKTSRQHTTKGVLIIQLFSPLMGQTANRDQSLLAQMLLVALRNAETANGVWYRDVTINELTDDDKSGRRNVVANFEYDTLHS